MFESPRTRSVRGHEIVRFRTALENQRFSGPSKFGEFWGRETKVSHASNMKCLKAFKYEAKKKLY
ncbi:MAG: hypothetical protein PQ968_05020 [Methanobacterium sp.]